MLRRNRAVGRAILIRKGSFQDLVDPSSHRYLGTLGNMVDARNQIIVNLGAIHGLPSCFAETVDCERTNLSVGDLQEEERSEHMPERTRD